MKHDSTDFSLLSKLWQSTQGNEKLTHAESYLAMREISLRNISMEDTLHFLYFEKPDEADFLQWIDLHTQEKIGEEDSGHYELSPEDWDFWHKNGYFVIKNAIDPQLCKQVETAIWEFLDASPENPNSWYKNHPSKRGMMLAFSQHETLQRVRNSGKIKSVYEQLYGTNEIHKTIDKVSFNPPETISHKFAGSELHWDVSLCLPIPFKLQGLLYLGAVGETDGAFHCVPGFHREIESWINGLPKGTNIRDYALKNLKPIPITGETGDFIIWHQALPHCASPNRGNKPRLVQYLSYYPNEVRVQEEWI